METRRFVNPSQPQTLYIATFLLYFNAAFGLLLGSAVVARFGPLIGLPILVGMAAAGYGIANEKRWGYRLGVATAGLGLLPYVWALVVEGLGVVFNIGFLMLIVFPVALFALLVHPMSRQYQRVWFS